VFLCHENLAAKAYSYFYYP